MGHRTSGIGQGTDMWVMRQEIQNREMDAGHRKADKTGDRNAGHRTATRAREVQRRSVRK